MLDCAARNAALNIFSSQNSFFQSLKRANSEHAKPGSGLLSIPVVDTFKKSQIKNETAGNIYFIIEVVFVVTLMSSYDEKI